MTARRLSLIAPLLMLPALIGCGSSGKAPPPPPLSAAAMAAVVDKPGANREALARAVDDLFAGYRLRRELRIRADIILCPLAEFQEDRDTPNTLAYEAAHHGATIL